jgi:hypothetical protein
VGAGATADEEREVARAATCASITSGSGVGAISGTTGSELSLSPIHERDVEEGGGVPCGVVASGVVVFCFLGSDTDTDTGGGGDTPLCQYGLCCFVVVA